MSKPIFGRSPRADDTLVDIPAAALSAPAQPAQGAGQMAGPGSVLNVAFATDVGKVRKNNEDYVSSGKVARPDGRSFGLWLVADGVGGGPQGELASRTAIETVIDYMTRSDWSDPKRALSEAFSLANRHVYEITGQGAAASTMVVALIDEADGSVVVANVGDSRAYLVSGGVARPVTEDHSIVAARVAAGQLTREEARTAPDRNVLTRSIGSETEVLVDSFGPRQLQAGERLLLCTDGVHGMIDDAAIGRLTSGLPIGQAAKALVAAAVEAGGRDNATALVGGYEAASAAPAPTVLIPGATFTSASQEPISSPSAPVRRSRRRRIVLAVVAVIVLLAIAGGAFAATGFLLGSSSPTPPPTIAPTSTASPTPTAQPTPTASPLPSASPTATLPPTSAPAPTPTK